MPPMPQGPPEARRIGGGANVRRQNPNRPLFACEHHEDVWTHMMMIHASFHKAYIFSRHILVCNVKFCGIMSVFYRCDITFFHGRMGPCGVINELTCANKMHLGTIHDIIIILNYIFSAKKYDLIHPQQN